MTEYVTVADVDAVGNATWDALAAADQSRAVAQANAWLSTQAFVSWETQPDEITAAGVELSLASSEGDLYADASTGIVKRKRVKGGPVETETEYEGGATSTPGRVAYAEALIRPYLASTGATRLLRRL